MHANTDTIAALSTVPGTSAVAVVRVSGPQVRAVLTHLCGAVPEPRQASLRWLRDGQGGERIDQALVLFFTGPHSYTGEDLCELQIHGSRATIGALLPVLLAQNGVRLAEPGEFTRRALEGGRMSLPQVEGLADLLVAETAAQRRQAVQGLSGATDRFIEGLAADLTLALAQIEARIEFPDEGEVADLADAPLIHSLDSIRTRIDSHCETFARGQRIREGLLVVIAGRPNAGKSSLLNWLAGSDVAIVSPEAGTTRDIVEVSLDLQGVKVILADTAGLRDTADSVEAEGVRRAMRHAAQADLVLYLEDGQRSLDERDREYSAFSAGEAGEIWRYANKCDNGEGLSVRFGHGTDALMARLQAWAAAQAAGEPPLVIHARQKALLVEASGALARAVSQVRAGAVELASEHVQEALTAVGRVTGRIGVDAMLDSLFGSFCIGK